MSGIKHDQGKPRVDLLPPSALLGAGRVLAFGAQKYDERNWEQGIVFGRLYGAAMRHMLAWMSGEDYDDESGLPHLHHALCCILMLAALWENPPIDGLDDRPGGQNANV